MYRIFAAVNKTIKMFKNCQFCAIYEKTLTIYMIFDIIIVFYSGIFVKITR